MTRRRKSPKHVRAGKKAGRTRRLNREYGAYLQDEKARIETPYRYHAKKAGHRLLSGFRKARKRGLI